MTFSDWPSQKQRSSSAQASATTLGHLSTPPRSPESPSSNALFSLPRIPYFFTITPFPLNPVVTAALPCSSRRMKRRFESNEPNKLNHAPSFPPAHEKDTLQQHHQQQQQQQQQQPPASSPDSEYGGLGIEGRVLKKMRGIKLDSESPPYHSPEESSEESPKESFARGQELATEPTEPTEPSMSTFRGFGTMKISTKSAGSIVTPSGTQHHPTSETPQVYSGMNHLLHQIPGRKNTTLKPMPCFMSNDINYNSNVTITNNANMRGSILLAQQVTNFKRQRYGISQGPREKSRL
ncbi:hypothetical protein CPB97_007692 [Podila verticillata]|nr:hypothetical protein CPB97_007692 [Podila verticillata]